MHQSITQTWIDYTPGHSTETTLEAKLNNKADFYASKSQKFAKNLPAAPIPTFYMNNFMFYSKKDQLKVVIVMAGKSPYPYPSKSVPLLNRL